MALINTDGIVIENPKAALENNPRQDLSDYREMTPGEWNLYVWCVNTYRDDSDEQVCLSCGAEFASSGARVQHIWDNRDDAFEVHGNDADIAAQSNL